MANVTCYLSWFNNSPPHVALCSHNIFIDSFIQQPVLLAPDKDLIFKILFFIVIQGQHKIMLAGI